MNQIEMHMYEIQLAWPMSSIPFSNTKNMTMTKIMYRTQTSSSHMANAREVALNRKQTVVLLSCRELNSFMMV